MNKKLGSTLIAMTIIIFMLFLTLGMFTKNFFGKSASAEVASAQTSIVEGKLIDVNDDDNIFSIDATNTGGYFFSVKNTDKDGNNRTQVKMRYKIIVETSSDYEGNVDYTLYKAKLDDSNNPVVEDETKGITPTKNKDGHDEFSEENEMILNTDTQQVDYYILKFTPDSEGAFNFKVKVESTQVD